MTKETQRAIMAGAIARVLRPWERQPYYKSICGLVGSVLVARRRRIDKKISDLGDAYGQQPIEIRTLKEKLAVVTHERDVLSRAMWHMDECIKFGCENRCSEPDCCGCKRAALTMAEKELENDHP